MNGEYVETMSAPEQDERHAKRDREMRTHEAAPRISKICYNPLKPSSDENEISLDIISTCSNIQVMRIKKAITKDKMS